MLTKSLFMRFTTACAILTVAYVSAHAGGAPVKMVIEAPEKVAPNGWLFTEGWPLTFSMEVRNAVAFVTEEVSSGFGDLGVRQALVIDDPDGCLDVRSFDTDDNFPFETGCASEDETYFTFVFDPFDGPRLWDGRCVSTALPYHLVDDIFSPSTVESLNKQYIEVAGSSTLNPRPVGPKSGGSRDSTAFPFASDDPAFDCYGFGADVDGVPGLVVWADIGAFKVMDENLNGTGLSGEVRHLRNGAGFVTTITSVLVDNTNRSNVKATIIVPRALFEPLIAIDTDVDPSGAFAAFDYVRQIDNGDPEGISSTFGTNVNVARARAIAADLPPIFVDVHAVLVDGVGPDLITDVNMDGEFTEADIAANHTLLSNVATYRIRALRPYNIESGGDRCPPVDMLVAKDLDGSDANPNLDSYSCDTGSARSGRRVPR